MNTGTAGAGQLLVNLSALLSCLPHPWLRFDPMRPAPNIPDPDGNAIAFAEPPDAASA